jgi:transposase
MSTTRRQFTPQEKVAILRRHLLEQVPVSDLGDQHGIPPTLFYRWQKEFFEKGHAAFEAKGNGRKTRKAETAVQQKVEALEAKLRRKDEVLAELLEEHILLKKELGEL